jgi:hypothetical protein
LLREACSVNLNSDPVSVTANQAFAITIRFLAAANFSNTLTFVTDGPAGVAG